MEAEKGKRSVCQGPKTPPLNLFLKSLIKSRLQKTSSEHLGSLTLHERTPDIPAHFSVVLHFSETFHWIKTPPSLCTNNLSRILGIVALSAFAVILLCNQIKLEFSGCKRIIGRQYETLPMNISLYTSHCDYANLFILHCIY
jgi:hypothetical protein